MTRTFVVVWVLALVALGRVSWAIGRARRSTPVPAARASWAIAGPVDPPATAPERSAPEDPAITLEDLPAGAPITRKNADEAREVLEEHVAEVQRDAQQKTASVEDARLSLEQGVTQPGPE